IEAEERAHREAEEESENRSHRRRPRHRNSRRRGHGDRIQSEIVEPAGDETPSGQNLEAEAHAEEAHPQEAVGGEHHDEAEHRDAERIDEAAHHHDRDHHDHSPQDSDNHEEQEDRAETDEPVSASLAAAPELIAEAAPVDISEALREASEDGAHDHHAEDESGREELISEDASQEAQAGVIEEARVADGEGPASEEEEVGESVGGDDVLEEVPERAFRPRRQYKIQEVIKRRQVMLVQVVKEERG